MIKTEMRNEKTIHIDKESTAGMLRLIQDENYNAVKAIEDAMANIEKACDSISERLSEGGRLIYIGAGTSGRLGIIDAAECPPTYGVDAELISGIIAGGYDRLHTAGESVEDISEQGIEDLKKKNISDKDCVLGISVAGNASYVADALKFAREKGSLTIGLTCNDDSRLAKESDIAIITDTGAEVITGSTRMKAGSSHKMILNMISTCVMIKQGHVYENLMINLKPSNIKLTARCISIVSDIIGCDRNDAEKLLEKYDWSIRKVVDAEASR